MTDKIHMFSTKGKTALEIYGELHDKIEDVIYDYDGVVPVAVVVGVLEMVKIELMEKEIRIAPVDDAS